LHTLLLLLLLLRPEGCAATLWGQCLLLLLLLLLLLSLLLLLLLSLLLLGAFSAAVYGCSMQPVVAAAESCPHELPLVVVQPRGALQVMEVQMPYGCIRQPLQEQAADNVDNTSDRLPSSVLEDVQGCTAHNHPTASPITSGGSWVQTQQLCHPCRCC
jgi:hypothetical protein